MKKKKTEYQIGDVVRMFNCGGCYTTYENAFHYFGIKGVEKLEPPEDYNKYNWVIIGIAKHGFFDNLVYCLQNVRREKIVTSSDYFICRQNVKTKFTESLKNKEYKIGIIPNCKIRTF